MLIIDCLHSNLSTGKAVSEQELRKLKECVKSLSAVLQASTSHLLEHEVLLDFDLSMAVLPSCFCSKGGDPVQLNDT